jgi:gamma-glutamyltranspeptidase/glutathione hydrolase/leukotriene-C4 hydrolase
MERHFLEKIMDGMGSRFTCNSPPLENMQLIPNVVQYEKWTTVYGDRFELSADVRAFLQKRGNVPQGITGGTICQFIVQDLETTEGNKLVGKLVGVSDPRKGGLPAGY